MSVEDSVRDLLRAMGEDPDREGLRETPARHVKAMLEIASQPGDPAELLQRTFDVDVPADQMITVGPIRFVSLCEHHLLPFTGTGWIGYIPDQAVVGLSKLPRLLDHYAGRPQMQERLTTQVAQAIQDHLQPVGVGVVITAAHACMGLRGVRKPEASMTTSVLFGALRDKPEARAEFLALTRGVS